MARRKITPEFYRALVDAFRDTPANAPEAARAVREATGETCDRRTARRAWETGWPKLELPPIQTYLEKEQIAARAKLAHEETAAALTAATSDEAVAREQARVDAIKARAEEGKLVRSARANVLELLGASEELLAGYRKLAPKVKKRLAEIDVDDLDPEKAARLLWRISISARAAVDAGMRVLQAERLLLGQPMEIIGFRDMDDMDESDVLEELEQAAEMAARVRERKARREGRLRLLQGGKVDPPASGGNGVSGPATPAPGSNGKGSV